MYEDTRQCLSSYLPHCARPPTVHYGSDAGVPCSVVVRGVLSPMRLPDSTPNQRLRVRVRVIAYPERIRSYAPYHRSTVLRRITLGWVTDRSF